jgi:hypothetical protein
MVFLHTKEIPERNYSQKVLQGCLSICLTRSSQVSSDIPKKRTPSNEIIFSPKDIKATANNQNHPWLFPTVANTNVITMMHPKKLRNKGDSIPFKTKALIGKSNSRHNHKTR